MDNLLQRLVSGSAAKCIQPSVKRVKPRVLYCVSHAYPYSSNGYAVRTHGVATGLVASGFEVIVVTRPGFPWDLPGNNLHDSQLTHIIDGVNYLYTSSPKKSDCSLNLYLHDSIDVLKEIISAFRPSVVMAGSNWHNAIPVSLAAHEVGVPFYYEVRGFWEISYTAKDPAWRGSTGFEREVRGESEVAKSSIKIFTINRHMKAELIRRGVQDELIDLVPNGVPMMLKVSGDVVSRKDLGITTRFVIGYVGSFTVYEGLDDLISALALVRQEGIDVSLLLVGSGQPVGVDHVHQVSCETAASYLELANQLGVQEYLFLPGRMSHKSANEFYKLIDLVVIPRKPLDVCELVTPMKPIEAAGQGKCVLMSDVAPLADLAHLSSNFKLYDKNSVQSLAEKIVQELNSLESFSSDHERLKEFTWINNVKPMVSEFIKYARL